MASCALGCIKFILGTFNLILLIPAIIIIVFGAKAILIPDNVEQVVDAPHESASGLIVIGVIIFVIAFLGCWGSIKENQCMLLSYASILSILVITELFIGGMLFAFRHKSKDVAQEKFMDQIRNYNLNDPNDPKNLVIDDLQKNLKCCGASGAKDYNATNLPLSCCPQNSESSSSCTENNAYIQGCVKAIVELITDNYSFISLFVVVFALIQIIGILFSCLLARSIRSSYHVV